MKTKKEIREKLNLPAGRIQISAHGCDTYSVQVFKGGKCLYDCPAKKADIF
jgi:hypothetical protein